MRSRRRKGRWLAVIGLAVLLLLGTAYAYLRVEWEGADLGDNLATMLNKRMRGRISIGAIEWQPKAIKTLVTGGWVPLTVYDVKVWDDCALSTDLGALDEGRLGDPNEDCTLDHRPDPDPTSKRKPRKLLVDAPRIDAEIDVHAALFGNHDLVFRKVVVHGGKVLLEQTREPYPLHAYDRTIVSVITAFYPRMKAGFRAGIYAEGAAPKFDLRDIKITDVDVTLQFGQYAAANGKIGYAMAGHIEDVDVDLTPTGDPETYLHMNATDPLVPKFYVRLALAGKHSRLRIFDEGKRETFVMPGGIKAAWAAGRKARYEVELSQIKINRLAQLPDQWAKKDYVANNLEMDITAHTIPCKVNGIAGNPKDGADLHLTGKLLEWWDRPYDGKWDLSLAVKNFGPTLRSCINPQLGGDNLHGTIKLSGPFIAMPKVQLDLAGLDFDIPLSAKEEPLRLTLAEVDGHIDLVNEQGQIQKTTALIRGGKEPGEVMVSATFGLKPLYSVADIDIIKPIDIGRFLPPRAVSSVGKFLSGQLRVRGDVIEGFALENFDLALGRTPEEKAIRVYNGRIFTKDSFDWINIEDVEFQAGRSHAVINGAIEYLEENGEFYYRNLRIRGDYPDLSMWLERFGLPPLVQSAGGPGEIVLDGPIKNPTINVRVMLAGVPCIDTLRVDNAVIKDGILNAKMSTTGLGGNLSGTVRADIASAVKVIQRLELTGTKVDAAKLCGLKGKAKGTIDNVKISITEPTRIDPNKSAPDWLASMTLTATAPKLNIMGESYSRVAIRVNQNFLKSIPSWLTTRLDPDDIAQCDDAAKRGGFCALVEATRDLGGKLGTLIADVPAQRSGRVTLARRLGGTIALDDIPLTVLEPFIGKGTMGGLISTTLHLGGSANAPSVDVGSTINLTRAWIGGAYIGDTQLYVIPTTFGNVDAVRIYGQLMAGALNLDAIIGTVAPHPVDLVLYGRRIEVGPFVDITKKLGFTEELQAWATGTVTVRTELKPLGGRPSEPEAWVELTEVEAIVNHRTRDGRRMPIRFEMVPRNERDKKVLSLRLTRSTLELACRNYTVQTRREPCPARLVTPAGIVEISGGATTTQMQISALGHSLDLRRLAPLFENQLEDISGTLELNAKVGGTFEKPTYEASLDVKDQVSLRLPGGESVLQILGPRTVMVEGQPQQLAGAQIKIRNGTVGFGSFTINVKDERKDEQGELEVAGSIALSGLKPATWGVAISGKIAGKMLSAIAPNALAQGSGLARIDATLSGKGALPKVDATLTFDPEEGTRAQPLSIFPRGVRREIALLGGSVEITTEEVGSHRRYTLEFTDNPISATIDNEGRLLNVRGNVVLSDGKLDHADVSLDAENIPYRKPGVLDLNLSASNMVLRLPRADAAWQASGSVAIVNGAYRKNFLLTEVIRPAPDIVAPAKPFWDEYPSIGNADLDLDLEVRKFAVDNNIAKIDLGGPRLRISGSPKEPRMSGAIRVLAGEFKMQGVRARFMRTGGSIDFAENDKATNPSLDITSDAPDYVDLSGQSHTISLSITGTLELPLWDLRTSTGYDKSQTLNLLLLGRTPEQFRRSLGDTTPGSDPTRIDPSTNPSGGVGDQLVKDLAGDWVSSLLGSSLTRFTGLDVLRFEVGFGSIGIYGARTLGENITLVGRYEQTVRGSTGNLRGELRTPYHPGRWLQRRLPWRIITNDNVSAQAGYLSKYYNDPSELDIDDLHAKVVYRLFIP
ncbi:MAG TPA: translocation/assembly module TamB domain-containing protein [Kofleriaceae bacterium]